MSAIIYKNIEKQSLDGSQRNDLFPRTNKYTTYKTGSKDFPHNKIQEIPAEF